MHEGGGRERGLARACVARGWTLHGGALHKDGPCAGQGRGLARGWGVARVWHEEGGASRARSCEARGWGSHGGRAGGATGPCNREDGGRRLAVRRTRIHLAQSCGAQGCSLHEDGRRTRIDLARPRTAQGRSSHKPCVARGWSLRNHAAHGDLPCLPVRCTRTHLAPLCVARAWSSRAHAPHEARPLSGVPCTRIRHVCLCVARGRSSHARASHEDVPHPTPPEDAGLRTPLARRGWDLGGDTRWNVTAMP